MVSEEPCDLPDSTSHTFDMTITNPLFDFDYEFTLISDNQIFRSDESDTETIMDEVQTSST